MRLNRVLLLAATINILIFALVFTISCSDGEDGKKGKEGTRCIVNDDWDIICDNDVNNPVGHLEGGDGAQGAQGPKGNKGKTGEGCWVTKTDAGTWDVFCGSGEGDKKGTLETCTVESVGSRQIDILCGSTQVNLCGKEIYNASTKRCDEDAGILPIDSIVPYYCGPQKEQYDKRKQYCGFTATSTVADTLYSYCRSAKEAIDTSLYPNKNAWGKEYCQWKGDTTVVVGNTYCPKDKAPINKDSWKKEYCGYKSASDAETSVNNDGCDLPSFGVKNPGKTANDTIQGLIGPNELANGQGYCTVLPANKKDGKTTYSEFLCGGVTTSGGTGGKINVKTWQKQYCGFKDKNSKMPDKVYSNVCDNGVGEHQYSFDEKFCGYKSDTSTISEPLPYCLEKKGPRTATKVCNGTVGNGPGVAGVWTESNCDTIVKRTYNVGMYKGEYCGFRHPGIPALYAAGAVTAGDTATYTYCSRWNSYSTDPDWLYTSKIPSGTKVTKNYQPGTTAYEGLCGDGNGPFSSVSNFCGFCQFDYTNRWGNSKFETAGLTDNSYQDTTLCKNYADSNVVAKLKNVLNNGKWKNEYCKAVLNGTIIQDSLKATGACDNRKGPASELKSDGSDSLFCGYQHKLSDRSMALPLCGPNKEKYNAGSFAYDYCGWKDTLGTEQKVYKGALCQDENTNTTTLNDGTSYGKGAYSAKFNSASNNGGIPTGDSSYYRVASDIWAGFCAFDRSQGKTVLTPRHGSKYIVCPDTSYTTVPWAGFDKRSKPRVILLNEGSWKGEFCGKDLKVKVCGGNWVGDTTLVSTDPYFCKPLNQSIAPKKSLDKKKIIS